MLQAGRPQAMGIHIYRMEGQDWITSISRYLQHQKEAWYERQTEQQRQSGHSRTGVSEQ